MTRPDQREFFRTGRQNIVVAFENANTALGARGNTFTNRLDVDAVVLRDVQHRLVRFDFELYVLRQEFYFHSNSFAGHRPDIWPYTGPTMARHFNRCVIERTSFCRLS